MFHLAILFSLPCFSRLTQSGYVMAAVGTVSTNFNRPWQAFSSCSRATIDETLQGLENTPTNCLANDPRTPVGGPVCGDGIVSDAEECDDGAGGSSLCYGIGAESPCTRKGSVQCAYGECCNTITGMFKAAGSLCRNAMHQVRRILPLSPSQPRVGSFSACDSAQSPSCVVFCLAHAVTHLPIPLLLLVRRARLLLRLLAHMWRRFRQARRHCVR